MHDNKNSTENIEKDLKSLYDWSVTWKMEFNPETSKPAEEVLFTNRNSNAYNPITFEHIAIKSVNEHKH